MRILSMLRKNFTESIRDVKILIMTLIFGPLFVCIFAVYYSHSQTVYKILVINNDIKIKQSSGNYLNDGEKFIDSLKKIMYSNGQSMLKITPSNDLEKSKKAIVQREAEALIVIPENFSKSIQDQKIDPQNVNTCLTIYGDLQYEKYIISAIYSNAAAEEFINKESGKKPTYKFIEKSVVTYKERTEFEATIPSALLLGIIMILFTAAISVIREVDEGTIRRLQISRLRTFEFLTAVTINQVLIGILIMAITLLTAIFGFGYKTPGSILSVVIVVVIGCIGIVSIGLITAGVSKTTSDILIIGNLPYFLVLLFSGALPIPTLNIFNIGNHVISINDIFPTTPFVTALKRILDQGGGLKDVIFELFLMITLTAIYFIIGITLFNRKHMKLG